MNQSTGFKENINSKGIVYRRLISGDKLKFLLEERLNVSFDECVSEKGLINFDLLCFKAIEKGLPKEELSVLIDRAAKKQFADNWFWRFLKKNFNLDVAIPYVTGRYSLAALKGNLIVNTGHRIYADQVGGTTTTPVTAIAYGTGNNAANATDTALQTEVARAAATVTNTTTTTTGDTEQWVYTFTAAGSVAITEEGLFDNNTSGGKMLARQVFSAVNLVLNDTIQFTHKIQS